VPGKMWGRGRESTRFLPLGVLKAVGVQGHGRCLWSAPGGPFCLVISSSSLFWLFQGLVSEHSFDSHRSGGSRVVFWSGRALRGHQRRSMRFLCRGLIVNIILVCL